VQSGPGWYLRHDSKERIIDKLKSIAFYVKEDDVLTLPPVRRLVKAAPMSGQQRRYYKGVLEDWEIQLPSRRIVELNEVITQLAKLRQIASGFIYDQNHQAIWLKSPKLRLLSRLLTDKDYLAAKPKVVIWSSHTAEIYKIKELACNLGLGAVTFAGSKRKEKDRARKRFQGEASVKLFIGQVDSGVGMNELTVSDTAVYYSNSLKVVSRQQSERRVRRKGSERHKTITYWDLVSERSVDEHILKSLSQQISLADYILSRIQEGQPISTLFNKSL